MHDSLTMGTKLQYTHSYPLMFLSCFCQVKILHLLPEKEKLGNCLRGKPCTELRIPDLVTTVLEGMPLTLDRSPTSHCLHNQNRRESSQEETDENKTREEFKPFPTLYKTKKKSFDLKYM